MQREQSIPKPVVNLGWDVDPAVAAALREVSGLTVVDAPESALVTQEGVFPVRVDVVEQDGIERSLAEPSDGRLFLVRGVLDDSTAARLEDAGIAYVDGARRAWLPGQPPTVRARRVGGSGRRLRPEGLRLAQLLADHPEDTWTEPLLARRGGTSKLTAHRLLVRLEQEGLIERWGQTRGTRRRVSDPNKMRRWLAVRGRPAKTERLSCFVRDPSSTGTRAGDHRLALTGAAGAKALGLPVLAGVQRPLYRVDADGDALEAIPSLLGGFRTEQGANLILIADPGELAFTDPRELIDGRIVAPPSRVMLDLYLEPRGEAAVEVFLDLWDSRRPE